MIAELMKLSLRHRWIVLGAAAAMIAFCLYAATQLPIDAYPDISPQKVSVVTAYPGCAPEEVERQVTIPIEIAMRNIPKVETVRSQTIFGLSVVDLIFEEGTETYWARQQVNEKLSGIELPDGAEMPELGPATSSCGEIYRYELVSDVGTDVMELRTLNEWVVIPRLLRVPGVADVSNFGGLAKQYVIRFDPIELQRFHLTLADVTAAVASNSSASGGSLLNRGGMALVIRGTGLIENIEQINKIFLKSVEGTPVTIRDVATVEVGAATPWSVYCKDNKDESVEGIALMRRGENPSRVLVRLKEAVDELNASALPDGVRIEPFYDRQFLVDSTLHTVAHSVALGVTLVVVVLLLFLGRPSMALLVAATIPFSFLFALGLMYLTDIPIGLLSIGAIDFGIIVDGAVIVSENIARQFGRRRAKSPDDALRIIHNAALERCHPVFVSVMLVMVAFLPLLTLTSIEGLLFRPMALTLLYALGGALIFALFLVPILAGILFHNGYREWENPLLRFFTPIYEQIIRLFLRLRWLVACLALCALAFVLVCVVPKLGIEFLPYMDEGTIWVKANFPDGISLDQTAHFTKEVREIIMENPDVAFVSAQIGRADAFSEPFPPSRVEMMIGPKPREQWTKVKNKRELIDSIGARLREEFPTTRFNFTQPIIDMVTQDTNGTSAKLAVELSGKDFDTLLDLARQTLQLLKEVPGVLDPSIEQEGPQAQLRIVPDRRLCARYNINIEDVSNLINIAMGGSPVGTLYEGERNFDIVAKLDRKTMASPEAIGRLPVHSADGTPIPLAQVASIDIVDGQTVIARGDGIRHLTVRCDVTGRDEGSFVAEAQKRFEQQIELPPGYKAEWLGMFANLQRAYRHFLLIIPATVGVIFLILAINFGSFRAAFVLLLPIPFAFASGVLALWLRDMHMNVSTGVGFATLFGVAIMDGVLMIQGITKYRHLGYTPDEAIVHGRVDRLRPGLMTTLVAVLGLLPASLAVSLGSDVQRPLATVIIYGLTGSTLFTLFVTPVFYRIFLPPLRKKREIDFLSDDTPQTSAAPPQG